MRSERQTAPPGRSWRMAVIAFLHFNIGIGVIWGSFSVLLGAVEARLGIDREASTMGVPLITLISAISAPVLGIMLARHSLRLIAVAGSIFTAAGFVLLAAAPSYTAYLLAFALLLGPGQAVSAIVPATLVTRWFKTNRGRALGFVCSPVIVAIVPLISAGALQRFGLPATYLILAALAALTAITNLFIIDNPPPVAGQTISAQETGEQGEISIRDIVPRASFWALLIAFIPLTMGAIALSAHMVPLAQSWGLSRTAAASLVSVQSIAGIAGTLLFGWLADRIGGARTVALMSFGSAVLWGFLLLSPTYGPAIILIALIGMHNAGLTPVTSHALSETFGANNFSRVFGVLHLLILPFSVVGAPVGAMIYARTGSYSVAIIGQIACFILSIPFAFAILRTSRTGAMQLGE